MTFMRKILDALNMNNWKKSNFPTNQVEIDDILNEEDILNNLYTIIPSKENTTSANNSSPVFKNIHKSSILVDIRKFWNLYPQNYYWEETSGKVSNSEYLFYGKILMLYAFGDCSPVRKENQYPVYFARECNISNPQRLHVELIYDGYLTYPTIYEVLNTYKVSDLKIIAESIDCKKSGKKDDLIKRLVLTLSTDVQKQLIKDCKMYSLSPKGEELLNDNFDYVEFHRHQKYSISLHEYNKNRIIGNKKRSYNDTAFYIISNRIYNNCVNRQYLRLELDYLHVYEILASESRYDIAIKVYLTYIYLKTCCIRPANYTFYTETLFDCQIIFTSDTASKINAMAKYYQPTMIDNIYNEVTLPPSFLNKEELKAIISEMLSELVFDYEKYNNIIRNRLRQYSTISL